MPYIGRELLRLALEDLKQHYSPLLTVSMPCMLAARVPAVKSAQEAESLAVRFGSAAERSWLDQFFRVPGGPRGKPYFMPGTGEWVQDRYPDRALQRRRKDFDGTVFYHPDKERWAFRPEAGQELAERALGDLKPVPLVALMVWMWRDREISALDAALKEFVDEVGFGAADVLGRVYDDTVSSRYSETGLSKSSVSASELADLVGAEAPPPVSPGLEQAVEVLESALKKAHYVSTPGLVRRILEGWLVGDVVVLAGPTGSGKTFLSRLIGDGLASLFGRDRYFDVFLEVAPDFDSAQFLGYQNLSGTYMPGRFAEEVLFVGEPSDPRLVILDEWNLAQIDAYFSSVLSVIESKATAHLPGRVDASSYGEERFAELARSQPDIGASRWQLPRDCMFLATCNSWVDEPETRLPISSPVKRRCRIVDMPNILATQFDNHGPNGIQSFGDAIIDQERSEVNDRSLSGHASVWDGYRSECLERVLTMENLGEDCRKALLRICRVLLESSEARRTFTPGLFRDVLMSCVYAGTDQEMKALGEGIADKILHQLRGSPKPLEVIAELSIDLPNADEIDELARRMGAFGDRRELTPLL